MAQHIEKHVIMKDMLSQALVDVTGSTSTCDPRGKGPFKHTAQSEDPSSTEERSSKKSRTSTPDLAKDDESRYRVS